MLLAYDDYGPGPVVVLLHGFPFSRAMWRWQEPELGASYRVIAPDLRGHGESAATEGVYPIDAMADDVIELLDALQLREPVVVGGLSMGGYVALSAVVRYPERFRGLILMDTRAAADTPEAARTRETTAAQVESSGEIGPVVAGMLPKLFSPVTRKKQAHLIDAVYELMVKTPPRAIAGALRGMAVRPDRTPDLPGIKIPSLVLVGEDDVIVTPDEMRKVAGSLPNSRFEVIPEAGHLAPVENPDACNRALLAFLLDLEH